jgi:hypothetical protein
MDVSDCIGFVDKFWPVVRVPEEPEARNVLTAQVDEAVAIFKGKDPDIKQFFSKSWGYAVLPKVFKGGFWVGGAYGKGEVYEQGKMVGFAGFPRFEDQSDPRPSPAANQVIEEAGDRQECRNCGMFTVD